VVIFCGGPAVDRPGPGAGQDDPPVLPEWVNKSAAFVTDPRRLLLQKA
jgi:hypothetical protein